MCKYCARDPRMVARGLNLNDFSADALAEAVLRGEFGNGVYRMEALGARYDEVQALVDKKIDGYARRVLRGGFCAASLAMAASGKGVWGICTRLFRRGLISWCACANNGLLPFCYLYYWLTPCG